MIGKGFLYKDNRISPSQFLMIVVLRKSPMYGYEVLKTMRDEFVGFWEPQTGAIYPALKKLAEHGLLFSEMRDDKEYYGLTPEGKEWLEERLRGMSREVVFMLRYFQFINDAAEEMGMAMVDEEDTGGLPLPMVHLMCEGMEPRDRLKHLLKVREMLTRGLEDVDKGIEKLEKTAKED